MNDTELIEALNRLSEKIDRIADSLDLSVGRPLLQLTEAVNASVSAQTTLAEAITDLGANLLGRETLNNGSSNHKTGKR